MPRRESASVIGDDVLLSRSIALLVSTLINELASPVSRRDALHAELASLVQKSIKHSAPPHGPGDRIGGRCGLSWPHGIVS
jgi:hypothetical protein